jgi:hypothetical protein
MIWRLKSSSLLVGTLVSGRQAPRKVEGEVQREVVLLRRRVSLVAGGMCVVHTFRGWLHWQSRRQLTCAENLHPRWIHLLFRSTSLREDQHEFITSSRVRTPVQGITQSRSARVHRCRPSLRWPTINLKRASFW